MLTETNLCTDCLDCDVDCRKNVFKHNLCSFQFLNQTSPSADSAFESSTWYKYKYIIISVILAFVLLLVILLAFRAKRNKTEVVKKYHTSYAGLFKINSKDRDIVGKKADDIVQTINAMEGSKERNDSAVLQLPNELRPTILSIDQPIAQKQDFRHLEIQQVQDQQVQFEEGSVIESMVGSLHDGGSSVADGSIRRGSVQNYDRGFYKDGVNLVRPRLSTMRQEKVSSITSDDSFVLNNVKFEHDHR